MDSIKLTHPIYSEQELLEKVRFVCKQSYQASKGHKVTCGCGHTTFLILAHKCVYCNEWYCHDCAQKHLGKSIKSFLEEIDDHFKPNTVE